MAKRVTIKDIAKMAGVSLRTVHCALNGKPGVSKETRRRIVQIAQECEYQPNMLASSLKRKAIRVGAALPGATDENRFYFSQVWAGVREYLDSIRDFNIDLIEAPFTSEIDDHAAGLSELLTEYKVDGLLTIGSMDASGREALEEFFEKNIPVVLMGGDIPDSNRLCCVMPDFNIVGRVTAELLSRQIREDGKILLCSGDELIPSHSLVAAGFESYVREHMPKTDVRRVGWEGGAQRLYERLCDEFGQRAGVAGCASVFARGSIQLGRVVKDLGLGGMIPAIASDLFPENARLLQEGVFSSIVHKHPFSQSYLGAKVLLDHLLREAAPEKEVLNVGVEIILQSNLSLASPTRLSF